MNKYIFYFTAALIIAVGGASGVMSQVKNEASETLSAEMREKMRDWQNLEIKDENIKFRLSKLWKRDEFFDNDVVLNNGGAFKRNYWWLDTGFMRVAVKSFTKPLPVSNEEMVKADYECSRRSNYDGQTKYLTVGSVNGVLMSTTMQKIGEKEKTSVVWTGYRDFGGKAQWVGIEVSLYSEDKAEIDAILQTFDFSGDQNQ